MQIIKYFIFFLSLTIWSQSSIETNFIGKNEIRVDHFVGLDNFDQEYYVTNNEFVVNRSNYSLAYSNVQLGDLYSVNAFNPLKINLFYRDFNTLVVLDNRLAEIVKVNFNELRPQRIISHISTAHNNNIWLFNENSRQLEVFDFMALKTTQNTVPLEGKVHDLISNYNWCWLLTEKFIYKINYFGIIIEKTKNEGFTKLVQTNNKLVLQKDNTLFLLDETSQEFKQIILPELLIKQFFVTNETLYIYDHEFLYRYQLITN